MARYSEEFKESIIQKMMPPNNVPVSQLVRDTGISDVTLYTWRKKALSQGIPVSGNMALRSGTTKITGTADLNSSRRVNGTEVKPKRLWITGKEAVAKSIKALNHKDTKAQRKTLFACQA